MSGLDTVDTATIDAHIDLDGMRHQYERDGVAYIPSVFGKAEMDRLRLFAFEQLGHLDMQKHYRSGERIQSTGPECWPSIWFWPSISTGWFEKVRTDTRIQSIVQHILGDDVRQLNNQLYFRMQGDGDAFNWHQDCVFRKGMSESFDPGTDYLQTVIAIDRVNSRNGGLQFQPGVTRDLELGREDLRGVTPADIKAPGRYEYSLMPGDMLIWNAYTPHASGQNWSDRGRMTYMNGFAKASGCQTGIWPDYLVDGEIAEVDPERIPYA